MHHRGTTRNSLACAALALSLAVPCAAVSITVPSDQAKSIAKGLLKAKKGDTVWVMEGVYKGRVTVGAGITLAAKVRHGAVLQGVGDEKVVTLTHTSTVRGFEIKGGTIGVYSAGQGNEISQCLIHANTQTGIMCVGHLPKIQDNVIAYNRGSGIQGWDVRSTISVITQNTIAFNANNGVSLGGNSQLLLENNIIAFNEKMSFKAEPTVKLSLSHNCIYGNNEVLEELPSGNFAFDPMFVAPRKMDFRLSKDSRCNNMGKDNQDIGARFDD